MKDSELINITNDYSKKTRPFNSDEFREWIKKEDKVWCHGSGNIYTMLNHDEAIGCFIYINGGKISNIGYKEFLMRFRQKDGARFEVQDV